MGRDGPLSMHILYIQQILNFPETSGNCRTYEMARFYVQAGHKVTILTSTTHIENSSFKGSNRGLLSQCIQREGVDIRIVKGSYSHFMGFYRRIWAFLSFLLRAYKEGKKIKGVDRIIAYTPPLTGAELGRRLARFHKVPLILEVADVWPDVPIGMGIFKNPIWIHLLQKIASKIYPKAQLLTPYSEDMKEQLLNYPVDSSRIKVIHNGVHILDWPKKNYKLPEKKRVRIMYAGTIGQANGIEQLVDAVNLLNQWDLPPFELFVIGHGNREEDVKAYAKSRHSSQISFFPWVKRTQLRDSLAQADIGVSSFAPYPVLEANGATKFFDYLANGLPVVLNYQGWQAQYLARHSCGLSSNQGDIEGFSRNLQALIVNAHLRKSMGENARKLAITHFDRRMLAQKSIELITAIPPSSYHVSSI